MFKCPLCAVTAAALGAALVGCSTAPPVAMRPDELPKTYSAVSAEAKPVATQWWVQFESAELADLEEEAQAGNLDVQAAAARVLQAQAQAGTAASALFPTVQMNGSANRHGSRMAGTTGNTFGASFGASYELDFWGAVQNGFRSARYSARAAAYGRDVVRLTTDASVANGYFSVLALRERITIARKNLEAAQRILAITRAKVEVGALSNLELAQQAAQVAGVEAQIPALEEQEREAHWALAILLGRMPQGLEVRAASLEDIAPPAIRAGLPSDLLQRRPDIAQAEESLLAAHANLDAARVAFLPSIGLTGSDGYQSVALSGLIDPAKLSWSIGASLVQTVFDGGRSTSQRDAARAREMELVASYRSTVLRALSDVETGLNSNASLAEQERLTREKNAYAGEAFRISELQYKQGAVDLLTLLQGQQTYFQSQDSLIQIRLARLQAAVGLYRALGGGWSAEIAAEVPTRNSFVPVPDILDLPVGLHF